MRNHNLLYKKSLMAVVMAFVFLFIIIIPSELFAQKINTVNVGNEKLFNKCVQLSDMNVEAKKIYQVRDGFTRPMKSKIDSIHNRCLERRLILKKTKKTAILDRAAKELATDLAYCEILEDVLELTNRFNSTKKVYFANGKYLISSDLRPLAKDVYQSAVDPMLRLSNLHPEFPFVGYITTEGYADESKRNIESSIYTELVLYMEFEKRTMNNLYKHLSFLRANAVGEILKELLLEKNKYLINADKLNVSFEINGKGSDLPFPSLLEHTDGNLRLVSVYWHILPNF